MAIDASAKKMWSKLDKQGRLLIPVEVREQLGMKPGETVMLRINGLLLEVWTPAAGWQMAQAIAAKYKQPGRSAVDELIAERRAEAEI